MELKEQDFIWIRGDRKRVDIRGVDEWYLKEIAKFVAKGGGWGVTDNQIRAIYSELENRNIKPMFHVKHALAKWAERREMESNAEELHEQEQEKIGDNETLEPYESAGEGGEF